MTRVSLTQYLALIVPFFLAACTTVGPDYRIPDQAAIQRSEVATAFESAQAAAYTSGTLPAQWWRLYNDATLNKLIAKALAANTDLRIAAANLAHARGALEEAAMAGIPVMSAVASPAYGRASAAAKGLNTPLANGWSHDAGAAISYQLDLFGQIARGIEAAEANAEAYQAAYDLARITVAAETVKAYVAICATGKQITVARKSVHLQTQSVETTQRLLHAGRGTPLDVRRARSQLEQLRAAIPPLQAQHRLALHRLAMLSGETPNAFVKELAACEQIPHLASPIPVGDGAALLRRRPDIRQAERNLAAATARIGIATAALYPNITLGLSGGSTGPMSTLGDDHAFRWSLGPLISWTIPNTGTARSRIRQSEASAAAALATFDGVVLNALQETESALTLYARELDRHADLEKARDHSREAANMAEKLYRHGRSDFMTSLDASRTLASTESLLAASAAQLGRYQVALFLALGGGWEKTPPLSGTHEAPPRP
jgi:NodT family efflux transporter outer membrane factor (OMF) lipoprotein